MYPGKFIVFEGIDGSGKSTQAKLLADYLNNHGRPAVLNREPSDSLFGKLIRAVIKNRRPEPSLINDLEDYFLVAAQGDKKIAVVKAIFNKIQKDQPLSEIERQRIFIMDRKMDLVTNIIPKLGQGVSVVQDRYEDSTFAYGLANGASFQAMRLVQQRWLEKLYHFPDLTIFIDLDPAAAVDRLEKGGRVKDRYETTEILKAVSAAYLNVFTSRNYGKKPVMIDGAEDVETVHQQVISEAGKLFSSLS